ncbi:hypothetical protein F444_20786 [Phytophthora nicotianae P1976]|uniref:Uncharacterized protein n=1 Tax=Phytophthora nicotianae P1976 TaxID=1317066 RepID=A0A080Z3F5_PHYNI|nr:hypothetical protein F444_20786 [Phytophthora nicotianae P1976]
MTVVLEKWSREERMVGIRSHFNNIWMKSEFWRWQGFNGSSGYATTSNPVEQFNRLITCPSHVGSLGSSLRSHVWC